MRFEGYSTDLSINFFFSLSLFRSMQSEQRQEETKHRLLLFAQKCIFLCISSAGSSLHWIYYKASDNTAFCVPCVQRARVNTASCGSRWVCTHFFPTSFRIHSILLELIRWFLCLQASIPAFLSKVHWNSLSNRRHLYWINIKWEWKWLSLLYHFRKINVLIFFKKRRREKRRRIGTTQGAKP